MTTQRIPVTQAKKNRSMGQEKQINWTEFITFILWYTTKECQKTTLRSYRQLRAAGKEGVTANG